MTSGAPEIEARVVYWGVQGAGKSTNLTAIASRLRADYRGELRRVPTPLDPTVSYEVLPIALGAPSGVPTRIEAVAVPGAPEHAPTRKLLLDRVDGIVFVIDSRREQIDANLAAFDELRSALAAYGRSLARVPLVLQYNKRDVSDPYALEELRRKLDLGGASAFEAVASQGTGVIETLTTVSKQVIRARRQPGAPPPTAQPRPPETPSAPAPLEPAPTDAEDSERTVLRGEPLRGAAWAEATGPLEPEDSGSLARGWRLVEAGPACATPDGDLRLSLVLEDTDGRRTRLRLRVALEPADGNEESD